MDQAVSSGLLTSLAPLSERFGSGDVVSDALVVCISLTVFSFLLSVLLWTKMRRIAADRKALMERFPWGGRIEKLDRALNELRTESLRAIEILKKEVGKPSSVDAVPMSAGPSTSSLAEEVSLEALPEAEEFGLDHLDSQATEVVEVEPVLPIEAPQALSTRLTKTRQGLFSRIKNLFTTKPKLDQETLEELRALLISSDMGVKTTESLISELTNEVSTGAEIDEGGLYSRLKAKVLSILEQDASINLGIKATKDQDAPQVVLMVGVNGVGKTTTAAKLAHQLKDQGAKVMLVAADTFRAAAVEQLSTWGQRLQVEVVKGAENAKPATVVYSALEKALAEKFDIVLIDTAGRLHTKSNLMQELEGIRNAVQKHIPSGPHETILVVDGSTGQNAISQAREFHEVAKLTGLIVTKLDGTPKGGVLVAIKEELGIPVRYLGVGEAPQDLRPFVARDFVEALFDSSGLDASANGNPSAHGEVRRRRREENGSEIPV